MTNKCKLIVSVIILVCCHHSLAADSEFNVEPSTSRAGWEDGAVMENIELKTLAEW